MSRINLNLLRNYLRFNPRSQEKSEVKRDFNKWGVKLSWLTLHRLQRYSPEQYAGILELVDRVKAKIGLVSSLKVSAPENIPDIDFSRVSEDFVIATCLEGKSLDLRKLRERISFYQPGVPVDEGKFRPEIQENKVIALLNVIEEERGYFQRLALKPEVTVEKVFKALGHGKEKLGFLNVVVYRPVGDGKWKIIEGTRQWNETSPSKYEEGAFPETTLKSVVEGSKTIYDVNIENPETFHREGLVPDESSIQNDLENSKGPGRMLFIKLVSNHGVEAVVHIHNRVKRDESFDPPPLLPEAENEAQAIKTALELYFDELVRAIEAARGRGNAWKRKNMPERLFSSELSRAIFYRWHGHEGVAEIVDEQNKSNPLVLSTLYKFINEVGSDCWGAMPEQFTRERLLTPKAVYQWVNGERASYTSARQKVVPMLKDKVVTWIEIAITKQKFQEMGLQARAFYWLLKEAYLEELSKYIVRKGKFKLLNYLLAAPSLLWAGFYVLGWVDKPPAEIAKISATLAYLAVQPRSFEAALKYFDDVYPNPYQPDKKPPQEYIEIARAVLPKGVKFDEETFVVEGDYEGIEHLIPDPTKGPGEKGGILEARDPVVNEFVRRRLKYEDRAGRDLLVVMRVTIDAFRRYFEEMRRKKLEYETKQKVLKAAKNL